MQAAARDVSPRELAHSLAALWRTVAHGHEEGSLALITELGLSITQVKTLFCLEHCEAPLTVGELSARLGISVAAASRTADGLLRRGWLERREDEHDRRVKLLRLTREGASVARRIHDARMQGLEAFAASLSAGRRARLQRALADLDAPRKD